MSQANDLIYSSAGYHEEVHDVTPEADRLITAYRSHKFGRFMISSGSVLEFGAGPGWNILNVTVDQRIAVDVSSKYASRLTAAGIEFHSDLSQIPDGGIDRIICSHVLEHLSDPASAITEMRRVMRKHTGMMILVVPLEPQIKKRNPKDCNHHLYSWNAQTFPNFLSACGLNVYACEVKRTGYDRYAAELAVRLGGGDRLYRSLMATMRFIKPVYELVAFCG